MKAITTNLMNHIHQDVTTLASCWLVTRTDGKVFAFTDHDKPLLVNGVIYEASSAYLRTALKSDQTLSVDNMDVTGILDSGAISDADLKSGRYDYAQVQLFLVNWADLSQGILKMRSGTFGESVWTPTGTFRAELRGLTQALITDVTKSYLPLCRADLGDSKCKIPLAPAKWAPDTPVVASAQSVTVVSELGGVSSTSTGLLGVILAALNSSGANVNSITFVSDASSVSDPAATDDLHALAVYTCTTGGTTGATPPTFNPTVGATTTETTGVVWTSITPLRGVGTVTSASAKNTFVAAGVSVPATPEGSLATVTFTQTAVVPTYTIVLTIGSQTVGWTLPTTYNTSDQVKWLANAINAANNAGQIAATAIMAFSATNLHSVVIQKVNNADSGNVVVDNDNINQVQITNFSGSNVVGSPYMAGGLVTWVTGLNTGLSMEMKDYTPETGVLDLYLNMPFAISVGDKFYWQPGCDKTRKTCYFQYNNILNFRGEPDVPGQDVMLTYPDASS